MVAGEGAVDCYGCGEGSTRWRHMEWWVSGFCLETEICSRWYHEDHEWARWCHRRSRNASSLIMHPNSDQTSPDGPQGSSLGGAGLGLTRTRFQLTTCDNLNGAYWTEMVGAKLHNFFSNVSTQSIFGRAPKVWSKWQAWGTTARLPKERCRKSSAFAVVQYRLVRP